MTVRVGSLCAGYGGLDLALTSALPTRLLWVADNDPYAGEVLNTRFPGVPNLGDITTIDWQSAPSIDILLAGIPCQPFSHAGKRKGHNDDRDLTDTLLDAVRVLRPRIVILENVPGFRTRGFARVLGGLAALGFHARWKSIRASRAGAPHRRERFFLLAYAPREGTHESPAHT